MEDFNMLLRPYVRRRAVLKDDVSPTLPCQAYREAFRLFSRPELNLDSL